MKFTFDSKWIPAGVILAVAVTLVYLGKLPTEQVAGWSAAILAALGLESRGE